MKASTLLPLLILILVIAATSTGVFHTDTRPRIEQTTVRGEHATFQGSGLYRYDPAAVAREGIVWDVVDLVVTVPLFLITILLTGRGSLRARLVLPGFLFYFFYRYLMFATMSALNFMYPVYVLIFALSAIAFFMAIHSIDINSLPGSFSEKFPRKFFIGFGFGAGIMITLLWSRLILSILISGKFPDELAGITTLETQAIDLGMVVPLMIATSILLLQKSPWGYLLSAVVVTFGFIMCIVLPAWIAVPAIQDGTIRPIEAIPFLSLCAAGLVLAEMFLRSIRNPLITSTRLPRLREGHPSALR